MSDSSASAVSRRRFIGTAAAGVAVVGASTVPLVHASAAPASAETDDHQSNDDQPLDLAQPVVARVRDVRTGEVTLYVGTEELTVTDRTLARRLVKHASGTGDAA